MDNLDIGIMGELFRGGQYALFTDQRKSLRDIASKLGVDKETVRSRIAKLREAGFLTGWLAIANPNLLGVTQTVIQFDVPSISTKDDLIRQIKLVPGVLLIGNFYGNSMLVILYHDSEQSLRKATQLISRISGTERLLRFENAFPDCTIALSRTDWNLIRSLQSNPSKSYTSVSKDLGLSARTVKRRLGRLIEGKALIVIPKLNLKAVDGTVANLVVRYANPEQRGGINEKILSHLQGVVFRADLTQRGHGLFMLILGNIPQAKEISTWVKELPDISAYSLELFQERIEMWESYHELLERKLTQTPVPGRLSQRRPHTSRSESHRIW